MKPNDQMKKVDVNLKNTNDNGVFNPVVLALATHSFYISMIDSKLVFFREINVDRLLSLDTGFLKLVFDLTKLSQKIDIDTHCKFRS